MPSAPVSWVRFTISCHAACFDSTISEAITASSASTSEGSCLSSATTITARTPCDRSLFPHFCGVPAALRQSRSPRDTSSSHSSVRAVKAYSITSGNAATSASQVTSPNGVGYKARLSSAT